MSEDQNVVYRILELVIYNIIWRIRIYIYQPLRSGWIWHKVNFKRSLAGLNSEFSFS